VLVLGEALRQVRPSLMYCISTVLVMSLCVFCARRNMNSYEPFNFVSYLQKIFSLKMFLVISECV